MMACIRYMNIWTSDSNVTGFSCPGGKHDRGSSVVLGQAQNPSTGQDKTRCWGLSHPVPEHCLSCYDSSSMLCCLCSAMALVGFGRTRNQMVLLWPHQRPQINFMTVPYNLPNLTTCSSYVTSGGYKPTIPWIITFLETELHHYNTTTIVGLYSRLGLSFGLYVTQNRARTFFI